MSSAATVKYNDFVIRFANVNGSGSASANGMFAKALFRMGIPVATRNIFLRTFKVFPPGSKCESAKRLSRSPRRRRHNGGYEC